MAKKSAHDKLQEMFYPPDLARVFSKVTVRRGELMSKDEAKKLLDNRFEGQRMVSPTRVEGFINEMNAGQWVETSQGVAVDWYGRLIDGQHRLEAFLVSTLETLPIAVSFGEDPKTFLHYDENVAKRAFKDILTIGGFEKGQLSISGAFRMLLSFDEKQHTDKTDVGFMSFGHKTPSIFTSNREWCLQWCVDHQRQIKHIMEVLGTAQAKKILRPMPSIFAGFYLWVGLENMKEADRFFEELIEGTFEGTPAKQKKYPVRLLREAVLEFQNAATKTKRREPDYMVGAVLIKAWNAYKNGEDLNKLGFAPTARSDRGAYEYWPRRVNAKKLVLPG